MSLAISPTLSLPVDAVTETFGILAKKGAGKSNAAVVMAEEMWDAGVPWVAIDPKGDWWGLRSSGDGKSPGLSLPVFGGRHGDIPLEASSGAMLADLILSEYLTCVLDVSEFTKAETIRFLVSFADRLYRQAEDQPIHLFLEEAHEYLPQRVMRDEARLVGAWQKIVKQGRFKGLGCTLVSQRSASLNKDVLTQVDTLIVLRTTSPQDRAAVKAWVDVHAESHDMLDTLPSLEDGEAWVWSPEFLHTLERIKFRRRRTFDSGATPKVGKAKRVPATLADVDLDVIKKQMADTIEKAKAEDPKVLRRRIKELEKQVASQEPEVETVVETIPQPFVPEWAIKKLLDIEGRLLDMKNEVRGLLVNMTEAAKHEGEQAPRSRSQRTQTAAPKSKPVSRPEKVPPDWRPSDPDLKITGGAQRMLEALGRHRDFQVTRSMLGTLAKLKPTSGTYSNYLSTLRTNGLIEVQGNLVTITDEGMAYLGNDLPDTPSTTEEILEQWYEVITGGARRMLDILVESYPASMTRTELAEEADLSPSSGTFSNYLSVLRTNGLAEVEGSEVTASHTLFL